jgi:hypothetical protein
LDKQKRKEKREAKQRQVGLYEGKTFKLRHAAHCLGNALEQ